MKIFPHQTKHGQCMEVCPERCARFLGLAVNSELSSTSKAPFYEARIEVGGKSNYKNKQHMGIWF